MPDHLYAIKSTLQSLAEAKEILNAMQSIVAEGLEFHDLEVLEDIQLLCPDMEDALKSAEDTLQSALYLDDETP